MSSIKFFNLRTSAVFVACLSACLTHLQASIIVVPSSNANALASAVTFNGVGTGISVTSASLSANTGASGTFSANAATYGLFGSGIVLSTGSVADYGNGPNTTSSRSTSFGVSATAAQNALLSPISGRPTHNDVAELLLTFDMAAGNDTVFFNVVFGSEEFAEYVNSNYIDSFGLFVNGTNIAFNAGSPVNINHPSFASIPGTELDGVLAPGGNPVVTFSSFVGANTLGNTLRFIIADTTDSILDSTVYISALGSAPPPTSVVPEPASMMIWGVGTLIGACTVRRTRTKK